MEAGRHDGKFTLTAGVPFIANRHGLRLALPPSTPTSWRPAPENIDLEPVGTGPFQLVAYQKDAGSATRRIRLLRRAKIDDLIFAITPDNNVAIRS